MGRQGIVTSREARLYFGVVRNGASRPSGLCYDQGRGTLYPWTGLPIQSVLAGTHVCCLVRDRKRAALALSRAPGDGEPQARASLGKALVFHPRYASQLLKNTVSILAPR